MKNSPAIVQQENIVSQIHFIRGEKVILDSDLAELYGVEVKALKRAVRRNIQRFPIDFMFELNKEEYDFLRYQFGTLKRGEHSKYLPFAYTEQGVAMLSGILNSKRAIEVNIEIMRTFVKLRQWLPAHKELEKKLNALEKNYNENFKVVFDAIRLLMKDDSKPKHQIGF
ncbi:MAG TPA: ORF6N domain-containing protein [Bacteroidota bacterium]|nr:ORF6N domain-containing protein [Bacteroidota bacterium]